MRMMKFRLSQKGSLRTALGAVLGVAMLAGCMVGSARADDDDDDAFDTKILRSLLEVIGLRQTGSGIEYRERSPLVVPPSRNLPAPNSKSASERQPAWPNDPDIKRRKEAKALSKQRAGIDIEKESRPMSPNELRGSGTGTASGGGPPGNRNVDGSNILKPSELGYKGGLFSGIFGGAKEEYTTFTGETPRSSLIEPPSGYRTPSPYQPYGVGREKWIPPSTADRHEPVR
jgi:hypothetical protein